MTDPTDGGGEQPTGFPGLRDDAEQTQVVVARTLRGVGVSPGRAVGPVVLVAPRLGAPRRTHLAPEADADAEAARIADASARVSEDLFTQASHLDGERREIVETAAALAMDPLLVRPAETGVREARLSPARGVGAAADHAGTKLASLGGYLAERVADVMDVRDRLIADLTGTRTPGVPDLTEPSVVVARDLAPVDTAHLDPSMVLALVTAQGGPSSHTAILARSLDIPAIVGIRDVVHQVVPGATVAVDGRTGVVEVGADEDALAAFLAEQSDAPPVEVPAFDGQGRTACGHRVHLYANVASLADARAAVAARAEGVGLLRTEMCFLDRSTEPDVPTQAAVYVPLLEPFGDKPVVVRTLDAGSDKPIPYVTEEDEPNPALGVRGLRTARLHPDVLENQLEAIALAAAQTRARVRVMAPMVCTLDEVEAFVEAGRRNGLADLGIMVETPAAALMADAMLAHAQFASIGTNDLVQYTLAADRTIGDLADLSTPWQPSVLKLMRTTCAGGAQQARDVGVCGEAAGDPALAVVLVGLGVTSLSMAPQAIARVAAVLRDTSLQRCRELAEAALTQDSAAGARHVVYEGLPILAELGL